MAKKNTDRGRTNSLAAGTAPVGERRRGTQVRTVRRINRRLILILAVVAVVSGACIHALHAFMVSQNVDELRARALAAEEAGETQEAIRLLSQYLQFQSDGVEALDAQERLVGLLLRESDSPRVWLQAYQTLEAVLRKDSERNDARRTLVDVAFKLRRYSDAEYHVDELLKTASATQKPGLIAMKARANVGLGGFVSGTRQNRFQKGALLYAEAISLDQKVIEPYAELAELLASEPASLPLREAFAGTKARANADPSIRSLFPETAGDATAIDVSERVLERMIEHAQPTWRALLSRASHRQRHPDGEDATEDIRRAIGFANARQNPEALLTAASVEATAAGHAAIEGDTDRAERHRAAAREHARLGLEAKPPEPRFHLVLAQVELTSSTKIEALDAALGHLQRGVSQIEAHRARIDIASVPLADAQRLIETEIQLRWSLGDLLITTAELDPARAASIERSVQAQIGRLTEGGCRPELTEFLSCRLDLLDRDWAGAAERLELLRVKLTDLPEFVRRLDLLLGVCYTQLKNPDRRIEVFRRAKAADPQWIPGQVALAEALADAGRIDDALAEYKRLNNAPGRPPGVPLAAAKLVLLRELRKPASARDSDAVERAIVAAEAADLAGPQVTLLRAEMLASQKDYTAAEELLEAASENAPDARDVWHARFSVTTARDDKSQAERIDRGEELLKDAEGRFGDCVEVRLAKAELARLGGSEAFVAAAKTLADADGFAAVEQVRLWEGLARYASAMGAADVQLDLRRKIAAARPDDLPAWLSVAEIASDSADAAGVRLALEQIRRIEGPQGPNGDFVEGLWKISIASRDSEMKADRARLATAMEEPRRLLTRAAERRSYWPAVPRALGLLESLLGNRDAAFKHYERARRLGDQSPQVLQAIVDYHRANNRHDLAAAIIREAEQASPGQHQTARLAWRNAVERGDVDTALDWSARLANGSSDFNDRILHAQTLFAKHRSLSEKDRDGAEATALLSEVTSLLRAVVDEAPQQPDAWVAYVGHLGRIGETDQARGAIAEAEQRLPAEPAHDRLMNLARCYEAIGDNVLAREHCLKAVGLAPENAALRLSVADYFSRTGDLAEVNKQLGWLLDPQHAVPADIVANARKRQIFTMAATGRYEDVQRALQMLRQDAERGEVDENNLRAQVAILAGRLSLRDRREVLKILEELRSRTELTVNEKLRLVGLYEKTGDWPKGKALLEELAAVDATNATYVTALILGSLRNEPSTPSMERRLGPQVERLKALAPTAFRTALATAEFEAEFERPEQAEAELRAFEASLTDADSRGGEEVTLEERSDLMAGAESAERLKLYAAAEAFVRRFVEKSSRPEDSMYLATYLGRRSRIDEALDVIAMYADRAVPEATAVTAVNVVSVGVPTSAQIARAEDLVNQSLKKSPNSSRLASALAGLRSAQGRYDEAEMLYRRVLAEQPNNAALLNNLAWLLLVAGKNTDEASRLVNEAIAIAGPLAELVDTRGTIDLARGESEKAMQDLNEAFADTPTANIAFHLAVAYDRLGDKAKARDALERAHALGLSLEVLHATEHDLYQEINEQHGGI